MAINNSPHIHELVICANVFIKKDNKFLVLKRSPLKKYAPNVIHPVGGKLDPNENPYEAALREAKEETGITVINLDLRAVILEIEPINNEPYNWMIYHFIGEYESGETTTTEEGELLWLTEDEIKSSQLFPSVSNIIDHIFNMSEKTLFITDIYNEDKSQIIDNKLYFCK